MANRILILLAFLILVLAGPAHSKPPEREEAAPDRGDYSEALRLLQPLAEHGNAEAQFQLGQMYVFGEGVPKDLEEGFRWVRRAAEQGHAKARFQLGQMYYFGVGVPGDLQAGLIWVRKAAKQGHAGAREFIDFHEDLETLFQFQEAYDRGNHSEALKLILPVAEEGIPIAQNALGVMYAKGHGVAQDGAEAVRWWRKAAEEGFSEAQYNLGLSLAEGFGVPKDSAKAVLWWQKASEQDNPSAQFNLGIMYAWGLGVMQDKSTAVAWYYKAGMTYLKNGRREDALKAYDRINRISPAHVLGKKLQEALYP